MSYSRNYPCNYCLKKDTCTDYQEIEKAITTIHQKTYEQGHQGSGSVTIECTRMDSKHK